MGVTKIHLEPEAQMNLPWTILARHERAELWQQDRLDPGGNPVTLWRGATFLRLQGGERRQTPEAPLFRTREEGEEWFALVTTGEGAN